MTDQSFAPPTAGVPPAATATDARAGFWIRFAASLIDTILISIVTVPLQLGLGAAGLRARAAGRHRLLHLLRGR